MTRVKTPHTTPNKAGYMIDKFQQSPVYLAAIGMFEPKAYIFNKAFCVATHDKKTGKITDILITDEAMSAYGEKVAIDSSIKIHNRVANKEDNREVEILSCMLDKTAIHPEYGQQLKKSIINPRPYII